MRWRRQLNVHEMDVRILHAEAERLDRRNLNENASNVCWRKSGDFIRIEHPEWRHPAASIQ
eukprot:scaffold215077_cov21-Prasinocladus_malaysianus.AAC.1